MENKRTRKFHYELQYSSVIIEKIKSIDCRYHIFGIENKTKIKGFIYFMNPRTPSNIKKTCFLNSVVFTNLNDDVSNEYYKDLENIWESGKMPTHGKAKSPIISVELIHSLAKEIAASEEQPTISTALINQHNVLLEQNSSLLEHSKEMCTFLMKQNQQLLEENKQLKQTPTSITNNIEKVENNIENKTINFNVFLNEECKNAITLNDFVNTLKIEDSDLFCAKEHGLVEAITNIIQRGLKNCDVNSRPLHCTDTKRETLHIKDQTGWIKESGADSKHMKNAITRISNKNIRKLSQYVQEHPEGFHNVQSPNYEECLQMMRGVYGADEDAEKTEKKVIKNIAKSVYVNKAILLDD
jgi:hypothetical protein